MASSHCGCIAMEASLQAKIGRIHGCTRTLRRKVRFLLYRGHRPYMAHSRQMVHCSDPSGVGSEAEIAAAVVNVPLLVIRHLSATTAAAASGSLAKFAAIRCVSSRVSRFAAERRPGSSSK